MAEDVYCTLLLNDAYLPGAQVLAHSLRDAGTKKRLAVMVVLAGVSKNTIVELKKIYDYVIPVEPQYTKAVENLHLLKRPDLMAALTKIGLWKQTQFRKVVYVDADVVAMRAPDELFDVDAEFAACPDIGWPDCFNSGVMVVKPNQDTHEELVNLASKGESFDGADQGLLNQHFENWHRLSFTYNCTVGVTMGYQYAPALRYYGSKVSMVHFIGDNKPWNRGYIPGLSSSTDPYDKFCGHWWNVYNKHYGQSNGNGNGYQSQKYESGGPSGSNGSSQEGSSNGSGTIPGGNNASTSSGATNQAQNGSQSQPAADGATDSTIETTQHSSGAVESGEFRDAERVEEPGAKGQSKQEPKIVPTESIDQASVEEPGAEGQSEQEPKIVPTESIDEASVDLQNEQQQQKSATSTPKPLADYHPRRIVIGSGPADGPPTHYQNYAAEGRLEEFVLTRGGPVAQERYFRTGAWTYYVQQCGPDGEPIQKQDIEKSYNQFTAWDPTRCAPPQDGPPEADRLYVQVYENEWDQQNGASRPFVAPEFTPPTTLHLWYDIPKETPAGESQPPKAIFPWEERPRLVTRVFHDATPSNQEYVEEKDDELLLRDPVVNADNANVFDHHQHLKPVFPWEQRPRTVTRVFAGEGDDVSSPPSDSGYDQADEEKLTDESSSWGRFPARENRWDTDPAIRDYVQALRGYKGQSLVKAPVVPAAGLGEPSVEHMVQTDETEEQQHEEYIDASVETGDSRYSDSAVQTESHILSDIGTQYGAPLNLSDIGTQYGSPLSLSDIGTQYGHPLSLSDIGTQYGAPLTMSDIGTQYGPALRMSDSSTQYGSDGDATDMLTLDGDDEDYEPAAGILTPKMSTVGLSTQYRAKGFSFDEGEDAREKRFLAGGHSIGSTMQTAIVGEN